MRTTIERHEADVDAATLAPGVLDASLALHSLEDPRRFPDALIEQCERLLPADHLDAGELHAAWSDRSSRDAEPTGSPQPRRPSPPAPRIHAGGHRLELLVTARRRAFGIVLERYAEPFDARAIAVAGLLQPHLGPAFDHARLRAAEWDVAAAIRALTIREQEVLALVADGRTNRDIGLALFIEPRTVEKHLEHIRTKLGARSRADAAVKWARSVAVPFG